MKLGILLGIVILLVSGCVQAFASEVIFYDDFSTDPLEDKRWVAPVGGVKWNLDKYVIIQNPGPRDEVVFQTYNRIPAVPYTKYKVSFLYRACGGEPCVTWVTWGGWIKGNPNWGKYEFFVYVEHSKTSKIEFTVWSGPLYIDDVEIKKCSSPVEPISLGKVKALYN